MDIIFLRDLENISEHFYEFYKWFNNNRKVKSWRIFVLCINQESTKILYLFSHYYRSIVLSIHHKVFIIFDVMNIIYYFIIVEL